MRNAQQRGALCAHGELRNCLYQRQFRARRRHTTLVPPRGAPQGRWEFLPSLCKGGWRSGAATEGLSFYNSLQKASLRYAFCASICRSRGFQVGVNAPSAIM